MAKKKVKREPKPTPAKFLLPMEELDNRLRRSNGCRNIAVRLPERFNNVLWIINNLPYRLDLQDFCFPIENVFVEANLSKRLKEVRTFNSKNKHLVNHNRYIFAFQAAISDLDFTYNQPTQESDILWWFYSEANEKELRTSLKTNFPNHMYYDDSIFPALVIDKWSGVPSYIDSYIPLMGEKKDVT